MKSTMSMYGFIALKSEWPVWVPTSSHLNWILSVQMLPLYFSRISLVTFQFDGDAVRRLNGRDLDMVALDVVLGGKGQQVRSGYILELCEETFSPVFRSRKSSLGNQVGHWQETQIRSYTANRSSSVISFWIMFI